MHEQCRSYTGTKLSLNRKAGWCIPGELAALCLGLASGRHAFGALRPKGQFSQQQCSRAHCIKHSSLGNWHTALRKQSWHRSGGQSKVEASNQYPFSVKRLQFRLFPGEIPISVPIPWAFVPFQAPSHPQLTLHSDILLTTTTNSQKGELSR